MDMNERIDAVWCVDSETGEKCLVDRLTNQVIARGDYRQGYEQGRLDAFTITDDEIVGLKEVLNDLQEQLAVLKKRLAAYVQLGQNLLGGRLENE
jgi:hypothetical protein